MEGKRWGREKEKPFLSSVHASVLCAKFSLSCTRNWLSYWRRGEVRLGIILLSLTAPLLPLSKHFMYISYFCSLASSLKWFLLFPLAALLMLLLCFWLNFRMPSRSLLQLLHTHTHTHCYNLYFSIKQAKVLRFVSCNCNKFQLRPLRAPSRYLQYPRIRSSAMPAMFHFIWPHMYRVTLSRFHTLSLSPSCCYCIFRVMV